MGWSPTSAANAYLDTLKLDDGMVLHFMYELIKRDGFPSSHCKHEQERKHHDESKAVEPESNEFISALAAGMSAQLIIEVSPEASESTIALAAAARQTGGKLVCILPRQESLDASIEVISESGLNDMVEFEVGDPHELLPKYENVDFSLVDCRTESYNEFLKLVDVNPKRSVVVANNLDDGREGLRSDMGIMEKENVRTMKHPIGKGMEVTMFGEKDEFGPPAAGSTSRRPEEEKKKSGGGRRRRHKSKWVMKIDEQSGEEHIYRLPKSL